MRTIEFASGKKTLTLVCGLIWYPLQSNGSAQAKEILAFAKANSDDLKVLREGQSPHVGLTKKLDGAKAGQIALAALLADAMEEESRPSCLIAIALPNDANSFIFVAIRDGVILADSDFIGTRDEIKVRLTGDVSYGGWDCVICPDEWAILDANERDLASFLTPPTLKRIKKWELKDATIAWRNFVLPFVILAVVLSASSYGWKQWKHKQALAAEALRIQQEEVNMGVKAATTEPPKPWPLSPNASQFVAACTHAYQTANKTAGNWQLSNATCEGQTLNLTWSKTDASAWTSHLAITRPDLTIATDGLSAFVNIPLLDVASENDFTSPIPSSTGVQISYLDIAARMGIALHIDTNKAAVTQQSLPGQAPANIPTTAPSWTELAINIDSNIEPLQVVAAIDRFGLRISKIEYLRQAGAPHYKLTGVQYVSN